MSLYAHLTSTTLIRLFQNRCFFPPSAISPLPRGTPAAPAVWKNGARATQDELWLYHEGLVLSHDKYELEQWIKKPTEYDTELHLKHNLKSVERERKAKRIKMAKSEDKAHAAAERLEMVRREKEAERRRRSRGSGAP